MKLNALFSGLGKMTLLLFALSVAAPRAKAQIEDPTSWKYEVKKVSATEYELVFHLHLKEGWHIWSVHPGGDGYEIAPSFTFTPNNQVKLKGGASEKGKLVSTKMTGVDGIVNYMTGDVDYVQKVTATGKTKITGKHQYQVCNDRMCLPPKDLDFAFDIK